MAKVTMPQLGESVAEGTIGKWLKQPGDHVDKYEPLVEVITDKVNAEVPSPFEGVLREILVEEGATVPNNAEIAVIETADDGAASGAGALGRLPSRRGDARAAAAAPAAAPKPASRRTGRLADDAAGAPARRRPTARPAPTSDPSAPRPRPPRPRRDRRRPPRRPTRRRPGRPDDAGRPPAAPRARPQPGADRRHRRRRTDHPRGRPQFVEAMRTGSRPAPAAAGRRLRRNGSAQRRPPPAAAAAGPGRAGRTGAAARRGAAGAAIEFPAGADEVLVPMTQMRKGIAAQMTRALAGRTPTSRWRSTRPRLVALRETAKREYQAQEGIGLSYVPFVVKAAVEALKQHPAFNAHWTERPPGQAPDQHGCRRRRRRRPDRAGHPRRRPALDPRPEPWRSPTSPTAPGPSKLRIDDFGGGTFTIDNTG